MKINENKMALQSTLYMKLKLKLFEHVDAARARAIADFIPSRQDNSFQILSSDFKSQRLPTSR